MKLPATLGKYSLLWVLGSQILEVWTGLGRARLYHLQELALVVRLDKDCVSPC